MEVCAECARFGEEVAKRVVKKPAPTVVTQRLDKRIKKTTFRDVYSSQDSEEILAADYSKKIIQTRNSKGLTKKEMASKLNEKLSVISSLERGELRPDDKLIRKLEKELGISLREKVSNVQSVEKRPYTQRLTLEDIMKMK